MLALSITYPIITGLNTISGFTLVFFTPLPIPVIIVSVSIDQYSSNEIDTSALCPQLAHPNRVTKYQRGSYQPVAQADEVFLLYWTLECGQADCKGFH